MTGYHTKVGNIGDVTVTVSKAKSKSAADRLIALLEAIGTDIENSLPDAPPAPDQGLPGQQPGVDNTLPGSQPAPDQGLPSGRPPRPSQGLPGQQPGVDNDLPGLADFLKDHAKEIAAEVLKNTLCDPAKPTPK